MRSTIRTFIATTFAVLTAAAFMPSMATAEVVQMWGGSTHIWVGTGGKNYANHTQWVSYITVSTGAFCPTRAEAWTAGFYAAKVMCGPAFVMWYINRWVPSGNGVCGAASDPPYERQIACITIRV